MITKKILPYGFLVLFLGTSFLGTPQCQALIQGALLVGDSFATPGFNSGTYNSVTTSSQTFSSYGALINLRFLGDTSSLTTGLLYTEFGGRFSLVNATTDVETVMKIPYVVLPVIYDYWFIPEIFSFGAGFYYGMPAGNVTQSGSVNNGGTISTLNSSQSFGAASIKSDDYGFVLNAEVDIPVSAPFYATAQLLYYIGLENISTNMTNPATQHNGGLVALVGAGAGF